MARPLCGKRPAVAKPPADTAMKPVYHGQTTWDAQMVRDLLLSSGIAAEVRHGDYSLHHTTEAVWVSEDDEKAALDIVATFRHDQARARTEHEFIWPWRCPKCGEDVEPQFDVCWRCRTERPAS